MNATLTIDGKEFEVEISHIVFDKYSCPQVSLNVVGGIDEFEELTRNTDALSKTSEPTISVYERGATW